MSENWPVYLNSGELVLQPLRWRDRKRWLNVRNENRDWLTEWEATRYLAYK
jgi:ribosomal-protein-alanine N-acetyltransferase